MKVLVILFLGSFICTTNAYPIPLQGFGTGDQTTGSVWPPYPNAGQGYWSSKPLDIGTRKVSEPKRQFNHPLTLEE